MAALVCAKSAEEGIAQSQYNLAAQYRSGSGLVEDMAAAC